MKDDDPMLPENENPEEAMRLENDIMKLKLQAEFGAKFDEISNDVSPEMEQQFLKQVYDFEKAWEEQEITTVANLLGNPIFTPLSEIVNEGLESAWKKVLAIYEEKGISVDFNNEYPLAVKYQFATEELPLHETMFVDMPGMMLGFIYEEFHPNHATDMEEKIKTFLEGWFEKDVEKCASAASKELILNNGDLFPQENFTKKLQLVFDSFESFEETDFFISETSYDKQEPDDDSNQLALGYVEGGIRFKGILENGEVMPFAGPFKFYMECNYDYWTILYFVMPGWKW
ncbi:hypothetical protein BH10BAC3_BH10BAC3_30060 [soil metagenome]